MRHPSDGTVRRLLDDPAGVADADRAHVADCTTCLTALATAQRDADAVRVALDVPDAAAADVDAAWQRLRTASTAPAARASTSPRRRRLSLRSPVAAAVGVAVVLTGGGVAAAQDWFQVFRTERVATVSITEADLVQLPDLAAYGDLTVTQEPQVTEVADADAARQASGLAVPQVAELPRGVTGSPVYQAGSKASAEFTFDAARAAAASARAGEDLPTPPAGLDGARLRLTAGPGVAAVWNDSRGVPALVAARAVAPEGFSDGVPFEEFRDYLLALPGLPPAVAAQLRAVSADGTTLPIPLPAGQVTTRSTEVDGRPATTFESRDGATAGVVWVTDGVLTVVAGSVTSEEAVRVARGLGSGG